LLPHRSAAVPQFEPELRHTTNEPKGVLQKNLKTFVYLGAALLVIVAAIFSSTGKKTPAQQAAQKGQPPQPTLQDNTDNNVQDLKKPTPGPTPEGTAASGACCCHGRRSELASATPRNGQRKRPMADRRCSTLRGWTTLRSGTTRLWSTRHWATTAQSRTAAGPADCREGTGTSRRRSLRFQSCVLPLL